MTIIDETVEIPRKPSHKHHHHTAKMGYYDDEGEFPLIFSSQLFPTTIPKHSFPRKENRSP